MISSAERSTAPTSRLPHASVSEKIDVSARPAAICSTSRSVTVLAGRPRRELLDLGRELVEVVADDLDQRAARIGVGLRAARARTARRPTPAASASSRRRSAPGRPSRPPSRARESAFISSATSASTVLGRGRREVGDDLLHVGRLPLLRLVDDHEPPLADEEPERVARRDDVGARRPRARSGARSSRRRCGHADGARARTIFGRSLPCSR